MLAQRSASKGSLRKGDTVFNIGCFLSQRVKPWDNHPDTRDAGEKDIAGKDYKYIRNLGIDGIS